LSKHKPSIKEGITSVDLNSYYFRKELFDYCKEHNLNTLGSKSDFIRRILAHVENRPQPPYTKGKKGKKRKKKSVETSEDESRSSKRQKKDTDTSDDDLSASSKKKRKKTRNRKWTRINLKRKKSESFL